MNKSIIFQELDNKSYVSILENTLDKIWREGDQGEQSIHHIWHGLARIGVQSNIGWLAYHWPWVTNVIGDHTGLLTAASSERVTEAWQRVANMRTSDLNYFGQRIRESKFYSPKIAEYVPLYITGCTRVEAIRLDTKYQFLWGLEGVDAQSQIWHQLTSA